MENLDRVLVVIDNIRLRALLCFSLESSFPFDVIPVASISEAEGLLERDDSHFDLVISDYQMGEGENQLLFNKMVTVSSEGKFVLLGEIEKEQFATPDGRMADGVFPHLEMLAPLNNCLKDYFSSEVPDPLEEYTGITLPVLTFFSELPADVYIRLKSGRYLKMLLAGDQISDSDMESYRSRGITQLYINRKIARWILAKSHLEMESILNEKEINIDHKEMDQQNLDEVIEGLEQEMRASIIPKEMVQEALDNSGSTYVTGDTAEVEDSEFVQGDTAEFEESELITGDTAEVEESEFITGDTPEIEESEFVTGDGHEYEESEYVRGDGQDHQEDQFLSGKIGGDGSKGGPDMELKSQGAPPSSDDDKKVVKSLFVDIERVGEIVSTHISSVPQQENLPSNIATSSAKDAVPAKRAALMKELKKRRPLGKVLPRIKLGRTDATFFRDRTFLIRTISCALAQVLEWDSEASLEKLLYISHKHDLLMLNNPKLARIQTMEEFEEVREEFTEDDQQLFLDHPKIMSELVKADPTAPPEADSIILQHHEMPHHAGFPQKLHAPRVASFAVLLNISIHFAQYILDNPDWKFSNYMKLAQSQYTAGGSFAKVIRALKRVEHTFR